MNSDNLDRVGFIGAGRVTRFLLEGWKRAGALPATILVFDPNQAVLANVESDFPEIRAASLAETVRLPLVFLAVHPPELKTLLGELKGVVLPDSILLSLAPKIPIAAIQSSLGVMRVVRMIPNAPSAIGRGFNPVAYAAEVDARTVENLKQLFAPWGDSPTVPEHHLEAYAIVSAMGPTYLWFQWQMLRELAVQFGLEAATADQALLSTIVGASELLLATGRGPEDVIDMIPVKPLHADEEAIRSAYSTRLTALFEKLKVS